MVTKQHNESVLSERLKILVAITKKNNSHSTQNGMNTRLARLKTYFETQPSHCLGDGKQQQKSSKLSNEEETKTNKHKSSEYFSQILFRAYIVIYTTLTHIQEKTQTQAFSETTLTPAYKT